MYSDPLFVYYRVEDANSSTIITTPDKTTTTYWIDCNDSNASGTTITSSNCYAAAGIPPTKYKSGDPSAKLTGTSLSFNGSCGGYALSSASSAASTGSTVYVYCRIGVSLRSNFSFTDITCQLT